MLERINEELKRRTYVIRIFPNAKSCLRLIRALTVEIHENWIEQHRYLNMELLREHKKELLEYAPRDAEVQISKDGVEWVTVIRANLAAGEELRFEPASTRWLRVRFHQGGAWANHVSLRRLRVLFSPAAAEAAATPDGQAIKDAQGLPAP